jgi:TRAP transporter 4TM/12TM fusion protein
MSYFLTQRIKPIFGTILTLVALAMAGDVPFHFGIAIFDQQALGIVLGLGLAIVFIAIPARGKKAGSDRKVPLYDVVLAVLATAMGIFFSIRYPVLSNEYYFHQTETFIIGVVLVPLVLEGLRRTAGLGLVTILVVFLAYGLFADLVPGQLQGRAQSFPNLVSYLGVDYNALFGLPLVIITGVVILFIFLGQLLLRSGGSEWFTDLAIGVTGRSRGGSAKIAIVASGLFGSISGSAVSNVASTGVLTIPLMRRGGYSPQAAGAFEAVASTGGQIMPPIMGAAAFLMAERLAIGYSEVIVAALLPALLYYFAVFIQADVEAARRNIPPIPREQMRPVLQVLREGWFFILPFAVLIIALFWLNRRPETAALWAAGSLIVVSLVFGYKGKRLNFRDILHSLSGTGAVAVDIIIVGAMAGILIGIIEITGLSFGLTFLLVQLGKGSLLLLLLLTAIVSVILGMGMPTTAIYLIVATLAAPPLRELGVDAIAADMFVLYYGLLSMITPPVAIAAFTAANLAEAKPMQTALLACRYGWPAFIMPFLFVLSPSLLLQGTTIEVIQAVVTAVAGVWLASAGLGGYFRKRLDTVGRGIFLIGGIALLIPANAFAGALWVEFAGIALAVAGVLREIMTKPAQVA